MPIPAPPNSGPATGPCSWDVDPGALGVCADWADRPEVIRDAALEMASLFLWSATGRQYGVCPVTVRPVQGRACGEEALYQDYAVLPGHADGSGGAYLFAGRWYNGGCDSGCCGEGCAVVLRGPVANVLSVVVASEAVEESAYRVDLTQGQYLLIRTDGPCWPTCSREPGDFEVTYSIGRELPAALQVAAALLACEYAKYFAGGACALPAKMTRLSRQGVDIEVDTGSASDGTTGIRQVDDVITSLNPSKRRSPPVLLSPDLPDRRDRVTVIG